MTKTVSAHQRLRAEHLISLLNSAKDACIDQAVEVPLFVWSAAYSHFSNLKMNIERAVAAGDERLDHHIEMAEINLGHFEKQQAAA